LNQFCAMIVNNPLPTLQLCVRIFVRDGKGKWLVIGRDLQAFTH